MTSGLSDQGFLNVCGQQIEYAYWPGQPGNTATLLLLHEGLGCVAMWGRFPGLLSGQSGHAVLAWSRAGYGGSSPIDVPRPLTYMHDEARTLLPAVLDAAEISSAALVGHSDGASIAAIYAGSVPHDPRLAGIVLMAPHFFVEDISVQSITAARDAYQSGDLRDGLLKYHGTNIDFAFWGWNRAWLDPKFRDWNITGYLPDIRVPILAIQGSNDEYGTLAHLRLLEQTAGGPVDTLILDNCGHSPHRDQPEATLTGICNFIATL